MNEYSECNTGMKQAVRGMSKCVGCGVYRVRMWGGFMMTSSAAKALTAGIADTRLLLLL